MWPVEVPVGCVAAAGSSAPGLSGSCVEMSTARGSVATVKMLPVSPASQCPTCASSAVPASRSKVSSVRLASSCQLLGAGGLVHCGQDLIGADPAQQFGLDLFAGKVAL